MIEYKDLYEIEMETTRYLREQYDELADRLRVRDRELERLTKLLIQNNIETDID